jgi:hypothetical protein
MHKRLLILIQGDEDLKQRRFECDECGSELVLDAIGGFRLLFDVRGGLLQVIPNE